MLLDQFTVAGAPGLHEESVIASGEFQSRVCMAVIAAAITVAGEDALAANHPNRVVLSKQVLNSPWTWMAPFAFALATQGLTGSSADADITAGVAAIWNAMAGT